MSAIKGNFIGKRFNRFIVLSETRGEKGGIKVEVLCDCGNKKIHKISRLISSNTKSCGCLLSESTKIRKTTHGACGTPTHKSWQAMKLRCSLNNKDISAQKYYIKRGITVCDSWKKFANFYKDMGERPTNTSIDRIDNNGNYCKENCRWASKIEQSSNIRRNRLYTYQGMTNTMTAWGRIYNIPLNTLWGRLIKLNWSIERALTTKIRSKIKHKAPLLL